jgi:hypothetical protein
MSFELLKITFAESKLPKFKEQKQKGFVTYGEKNDFPDTLLEFYKRSPKHGAIVKQKARFTAGSECVIEGNQSALKLIDFVNPYEGLHDFKAKLALDYEIFNGYCFEVHYNKLGQIAKFYHVDFSKIRTNDHRTYLYLQDWQKYKADEVRTYDRFNPDTAEPFSVQLYYYREYDAGLGVYPLPPYIHGLQYIEIDVEIANFHNNNIRNGFSNGTLVQLFKGEPTPEQARKFERKFKDRTTGTDNAGGLIIQFNDGNERPAEVNHIQPSDIDKQFLQLNETVNSEIFTAHNFPPILMGQKSDGQLGARNELIEAYEMFHKSYVNSRQARLDASLEYVCDFIYPGVQISTQDSEFIGLDYVALANTGVISVDEARVALGLGEAEQKVLDSAQRVIESINSLSPLVANNVLLNMTINEKRALAGLAPIAGGDVLQAAAPADAAFKFNDFEKWHDDDLKVFAQFGQPESQFEMVKFNFAELNEKELAIMGAVNDNPKASIKEISTASRIAEDEVIKILRVLQDAGKIEWTNTAIKITDIGINDISDSGGTPRIELRYKYNVSPEAKPLKTQSRPFCIEMEKMNRLYTRQDIDQMTAILGYDVWRRRGGWYTVPDSEPAIHLPHCRHEWKQVYVRRRNNG